MDLVRRQPYLSASDKGRLTDRHAVSQQAKIVLDPGRLAASVIPGEQGSRGRPAAYRVQFLLQWRQCRHNRYAVEDGVTVVKSVTVT